MATRVAPWLSVVAAASIVAVSVPALAGASAHHAAGSYPTGGTAIFLDPPNSPFVDNFNPFSPSDSAIGFGMAEIYEPLIYFDIYTGKQYPKLATAYSYEDNHRAILFTIRPGVKWSNGTPFTAQDVAFTFNMILSHPAVDLNDLRATIQSVKVVGSDQVLITLKEPNNTSLYYIAGDTPIVPAAVWSTLKNPATYTDPRPVTTGPFLVGSVNRNLMVLKRNPHYWDAPEPYVSQVEGVTYLSNNTATLAMIRGQFTISGGTIPNINQVLVARDPKHFFWDNMPIGIDALYVNDAVYPFSLVAMRQAMSDAINRTLLGRLGEYGQETPVGNTGLPPTPLNGGWANTAAAKRYAPVYSIAKAKALLKAAGFHWSGGSLIDPKGKKVTAQILADSGATDWIEDAHLIAQDLGQIGIQASVQVSSVISADLADGTFDLAMWFTPTGPGPYYNLNPLLSSGYTAPIGQPASANYERWSDPATNRLLNEYPTVFNVAQQHAIIDQIQTIFAQNLPIIPLLDFPSWYQYNTADLVGMPTAQDPYAAVFASPFDAQYILTQLHRP